MKKLIYTPILIALFAITTKAQIVYTDVDPDTTIEAPSTVPCEGCQSANFFYFDINDDDTLDFKVSAAHYQIYDAGWHDQYSISVLPLNNNKCAWGFHIDNDTIGNNLYWQDYTLISDSWPYQTEGYAGLKLIKNNQNYYGWVRMEWSHYVKATIKDYAYNSVAGQLILAGQTTGIESIYDTSNVNIYLSGMSLNVNITNPTIPNGYISVYNISGQQIKTVNITSSLSSISMNDCSHGTYVVKVICGDSVITKSIIIQ